MQKILLIDDSEYILEGTSTLLRFEDYDVLTATNGMEGFSQAIEHHPDLIICDVSMPEMDGFTLLKKIRSNPSTERIPFIFLTARTDKSDMRIGMDYGADDYLLKPFTADELLAAITSQWNKTQRILRSFDEIRLNVTYALPHEFRTALNQIIGSATHIRTSVAEKSTELIDELSDDIISSAKRLLKITENFLVYAQIEALSVDSRSIALLQEQRTDEAAMVIADIISTLCARDNRENDVQIQTTVEGFAVSISSEHLYKIVQEIIDNSLKFSVNGSAITVSISHDSTHLITVIADQGRGMTPSQISTIGAYKQFDRMVHEQQGVGLGLIIAKRLVELHNGMFIIQSTEHQGTTITIALPLTK